MYTVNGGNLGRTFVLRLYPSEEYCKMSESMHGHGIGVCMLSLPAYSKRGIKWK